MIYFDAQIIENLARSIMHTGVCVFDTSPWFFEHFLTFYPKDILGSSYTFFAAAQKADIF